MYEMFSEFMKSQLYTRAAAFENGDCARRVYARRSKNGFAFLVYERLPAKDIHKEMVPFNSKKCFSRQVVKNWMQKHFKRRSEVVHEKVILLGLRRKEQCGKLKK
ncbi:hypothetical protein AVEN_204441-1 [Araneus ventricosus]|uniref:Uncharacterized protein n=1 Tax=Araneus ventricosus TaxID=182803 RepID=A0A4Y2PQ31_ARAVE|nr:hypothetical protein AVEN_204441-1 [Araneus ventricosus]